MYKMQLDKISDQATDALSPFFDTVPHTDHADGKYRLRRYSRVKRQGGDDTYCAIEGNNFTQSSEYNQFQGNVQRAFDPIPAELIKNYGFWELCSRFINTCRLPLNNIIDVHQIRIITLDEKTPVSPEGTHQDGYDCLCVAAINRVNVTGGHLLIYKEKDQDPICDLPLANGEVAYVNDKELWHGATSIERKNKDIDGHMDVFILTARYNASI